MEHRFLGSTGLKVSSLALGTMSFGGATPDHPVGSVDEAGARDMVAAALDAGVNLFDTADTYSGGRSEELLGKALGRRRDDVLVSTKVHARVGPGPNDVGLSRVHVAAACDASLRRLGTDRIDIYHVHGYDACTPADELIMTLDRLVTAGKVRYVACSNHTAWQLTKALGVAARRGAEPYVATQAYYSLLARELEWDIVPACLDQGVGILVWSPLAGGLLSGKFTPGNPAAPGTRRGIVGDLGVGPVDLDHAWRVLDVARAVAAEHGTTVARVALAWVRDRPGVSSVILGARTPAQLADNLGAAGLTLTAGQRQALDDVSARPLPYPHWFQRQFTAERATRAGAPDPDAAHRYGT